MRTVLSALVWAGTILLIGGIVCCRFSLTPMFSGVVAAGCGLAAITLAGILAILTMLMLFKVQWGLLLFVAIACIPPLIAVWLVGLEGIRQPLIHDISTDTVNPPEFEFARVGRERQDNSLNYEGRAVAQAQRQAYPDVTAIKVSLAPIELLPIVERAAEGLGWKLLGSDELMLRIEAQEQTALFGFVDDVVIRLTTMTNGGSKVDVRSVSRLGKGDFGANAARIRRFYDALCGSYLTASGASCAVLQDVESSHEKPQKRVDSFSSDS